MTAAVGSSRAAESGSVAEREPSRSRFGPDFDAGALGTAAECRAAIEAISREIATIECQIEIRGPEAAVSEERRVWLARARLALRQRRVTEEALRFRLAELGESRSPCARLTEFAKVCRETLDAGTVHRLWDQVDARLGLSGDAL